MTKDFFLGATTLVQSNDGIGRVARLCALALIDGDLSLGMASLLDAPPVSIGGRPARACGGSRLRFVLAAHLAAPGARKYLYNSAGVARAHPRQLGLGRGYAMWIHGIEVWGDPPVRPDYAAAVRRAGLVIANSQHTLDRARRALGPFAQARTCWLATEEDESAPRIEPEGPPCALILGRISDSEGYKGHDELIQAWETVTAAVPDARLLIAGGGSGLPALREKAAASPARENIDVLGFVPEADLPALWRRASVFAMPSRGEGFGLVYIEAMRHGVPVIASTHDAGQEINADGETGFNVSLDAPGQLAARLIDLLKAPALRRHMGAAGLERWRRHFRFSAFKERFLPLMREFGGL